MFLPVLLSLGLLGTGSSSVKCNYAAANKMFIECNELETIANNALKKCNTVYDDLKKARKECNKATAVFSEMFGKCEATSDIPLCNFPTEKNISAAIVVCNLAKDKETVANTVCHIAADQYALAKTVCNIAKTKYDSVSAACKPKRWKFGERRAA